jgi:hypothetical protein
MSGGSPELTGAEVPALPVPERGGGGSGFAGAGAAGQPGGDP